MKIDSYIKEQFGIKDVDIRTYSPLTLAYIGDGIFDIVIRSVVVGKGNTKASQLHKHTSSIVKAHTQAVMIEALEPHLTKEEALTDTHLNPFQKNLDEKNIVFVCHLGSMFACISHLTGISPVQLWQSFFVAPSSVTVLGAQERIPGEVNFRIQQLGDVSHLTENNESPSASGFFGNVINL